MLMKCRRTVMRTAVAFSVAALVAQGTLAQASNQHRGTKTIGEAADEAEGGPPANYLKRAGGKWFRVVRDSRDGSIHSRTETAPPTSDGPPAAKGRPTEAARVASAFHPYVIYPTGSWPEAVAIGDINGDGRNDVAMVTSFYFDEINDHSLHVWTQNPDGSLAARVRYALGGNPQSVTIGDVDGDGRNDVVVAIGTGIGVLRQNTSGSLEPLVQYPTNDSRCVRIADLNHDDRQDIVALGWGTGSVGVLLQQTDGTLATPVAYAAPHAGYDDLEVGDVNGDGRADVIVMSGQLYAIPNFSVLYQQTDGTLGGLVSRSIGTNHLAGGIGVGDVTGDTKTDVVIAMNWAGGGRPEVDVFPQQPGGGLPAAPAASLPTFSYPEPLEVGDVTNDGRADVVLFDNQIGVFPQLSDGLLGGEEPVPFPYATHLNRHGMAIGDVNGDGYNDLVVANYNYGLVVYLAVGPQVTLDVPAQVVIGLPITIQWTVAGGGAINSFTVSYSADGGATYAVLPGCEDLPASANGCSWSPTGPTAPNARVKVVARDASGAVIATDVASTVVANPAIAVTTPNTAVMWPAGTPQAITWTSNLGSGAMVDIELSRDGGSSWAALASSVANSGTYSWLVTNPSTAAARVRVSWASNAAVTDSSDANFLIDRAPIANAGADVVVELGTIFLLNGKGSSDPDGDALAYVWRSGATQVGSEATVKVTPPLGTTIYTLTVSDPFGMATSDSVSVSAEDTTPPLVMVVSPPAGSLLDAWTPVRIDWTTTDNGTISYFDVSVSYDLGATYYPVPGCMHLPSSERACLWTPAPFPKGKPSATLPGTAVIRVVCRDSLGNGGAGGASYGVRRAP